MRDRFADPSVKKSIYLDLNPVDFYNKELAKAEWLIKQHAKQHCATDFNVLWRRRFQAPSLGKREQPDGNSKL